MTVLSGLAATSHITEAVIDAWYVEVPQPGPWASRGACRHEPPELFFPGRGGRIRHALAVCARCPVQPACLEYALAAGSKLHGIWGGQTERGRMRIRVQRREDGAR